MLMVLQSYFMKPPLPHGFSATKDYNSEDRPTVIRYNNEYVMTKNFTFKIVVELYLLKDFKDQILEHHNMLNDNEVLDFPKIMVGDI